MNLRYANNKISEEEYLQGELVAEIKVFRKKDHWQSFYYYLGDAITFYSLVTYQPSLYIF